MSDDHGAAILARINAMHEDVNEIRELAKATNGRVRKLEMWQARVQGATSMFSWVQPTVAAVIGGGIVAVVGVLIGTH